MKKYPVSNNHFNGNELKYLKECIESGWISSSGPFVNKFERAFSSYLNVKHSHAVSSGTAALELACKAIDLKPGDEVILPANTIISCAQAISKTGATPIFVDSCLTSWNMSCEDLERHYTANTKAIMLVHLYGYSPDVDQILSFAKAHNLKIIEDASQAIGNKYGNMKCGSIGDISTTSFYPNKQINTGEGGMIFSNSKELIDKAKYYSNLCFGTGKYRFKNEAIGWNYRFTALQASVGLAQLEQLNETIKFKLKVGRKLSEKLSVINFDFDLPKDSHGKKNNIYWVYGLVKKKTSSINVEKLLTLLEEHGIETRPFYSSLPNLNIFKDYSRHQKTTFHNSEYLSQNGFYIPSWKFMKDEEINVIIERIISCIKISREI